MEESLLLCAKPKCHHPRQVVEKTSIYTKGKLKYMKTCCRHGVDDIPVKKPNNK
jgi:hypothetical protein